MPPLRRGRSGIFFLERLGSCRTRTSLRTFRVDRVKYPKTSDAAGRRRGTVGSRNEPTFGIPSRFEMNATSEKFVRPSGASLL
jgi:hypothetical protein